MSETSEYAQRAVARAQALVYSRGEHEYIPIRRLCHAYSVPHNGWETSHKYGELDEPAATPRDHIHSSHKTLASTRSVALPPGCARSAWRRPPGMAHWSPPGLQ